MTENVIKCVAIGDGFVGKTSLLFRLQDIPFQDSYLPTIFDNSALQINYKQKLYYVHLFDTAGQEEYDQISLPFYREAQVILVCFSVDKESSFQNIELRWLPMVEKYSEAAVIFVGLKNDLRGDPRMKGRFVTKNQAVSLAKNHGSRYIECSSKTDFNISEIKTAIMEVALSKKDSSKPSAPAQGPCIWNSIRRIFCCRR